MRLVTQGKFQIGWIPIRNCPSSKRFRQNRLFPPALSILLVRNHQIILPWVDETDALHWYFR